MVVVGLRVVGTFPVELISWAVLARGGQRHDAARAVVIGAAAAEPGGSIASQVPPETYTRANRRGVRAAADADPT
jgi:hypothetical protein